MNFRFSVEQEILRRTVRAFCENELKDNADPLPRMKQLGWLDGDTVDSVIVFEELGRVALVPAEDPLFRAACCIGSAQRAIDDAVRYAKERRAFGQLIGKFQAIAHLLADLQVETDGARWLLYQAAWLADPGAKETVVAGAACADVLLKATSDAMRVFGGYGLTLEFDIAHRFRDARRFVHGA